MVKRLSRREDPQLHSQPRNHGQTKQKVNRDVALEMCIQPSLVAQAYDLRCLETAGLQMQGLLGLRGQIQGQAGSLGETLSRDNKWKRGLEDSSVVGCLPDTCEAQCSPKGRGKEAKERVCMDEGRSAQRWWRPVTEEGLRWLNLGI